jgi:hypothetical protein
LRRFTPYPALKKASHDNRAGENAYSTTKHQQLARDCGWRFADQGENPHFGLIIAFVFDEALLQKKHIGE